jgi:hypothetical protein
MKYPAVFCRGVLAYTHIYFRFGAYIVKWMNYYVSQVFAFDSFTLLLSMQENSQAKQEEFILCDVLSFFLFSFFFSYSLFYCPSFSRLRNNKCMQKPNIPRVFFRLKDELENGSVPFFLFHFLALSLIWKNVSIRNNIEARMFNTWCHISISFFLWLYWQSFFFSLLIQFTINND